MRKILTNFIAQNARKCLPGTRLFVDLSFLFHWGLRSLGYALLLQVYRYLVRDELVLAAAAMFCNAKTGLFAQLVWHLGPELVAFFSYTIAMERSANEFVVWCQG